MKFFGLVKLTAVLWLDWFDDNIAKHRFYWFCQLVGQLEWWDGTNYQVLYKPSFPDLKELYPEGFPWKILEEE